MSILHKKHIYFNWTFLLLLFFTSVCLTGNAVAAPLAIHCQTAVNIELIGYNGLTESSLFNENLAAGKKYEVNTGYRGLALLVFKNGSRYPFIIGDAPFTLNIVDPLQPPSFTGSAENNSLYRALSGNAPVPEQYQFAHLMIQAKQLLESSHSISAIQELTDKKKEFHGFVADNYQRLQHSDMLRRLIGQYFMMHEYVNYHSKEASTSKIRLTYKQAVLNGVGAWLVTLKPYIPEHEILNYCVSLYYDRSMVTLASLIIEHFRDVAWCPGTEKEGFRFPPDLIVVEADGKRERKFSALKGNTFIAFVSNDCPVSMVETVIKARRAAERNNDMVFIVAPLQQLSAHHLAMNRMVSGGNILFVKDEQWRKTNLAVKIKLPLFVGVGDGSD